MGAVFRDQWIVRQWNSSFIVDCEPSIEFLELYALVAGIITWEQDEQLQDSRVSVFCNNKAVVHMVNNTASSCQKCMKLIRLLVLNNIKHNRRVFTLHIRTEFNILADALSQLDFKWFWANAQPTMSTKLSEIRLCLPEILWNDEVKYFTIF